MKKLSKQAISKGKKAWTVLLDGELFSYVFSYTGERVYMTFPTLKEAKVFRGKEKWKIVRIEIIIK